jgi:hypothetical protein
VIATHVKHRGSNLNISHGLQKLIISEQIIGFFCELLRQFIHSLIIIAATKLPSRITRRTNFEVAMRDRVTGPNPTNPRSMWNGAWCACLVRFRCTCETNTPFPSTSLSRFLTWPRLPGQFSVQRMVLAKRVDALGISPRATPAEWSARH